LLDLLRFAFIQRGSVHFWMHVAPKTKGQSTLRQAAKLSAEKAKAAQLIAVRLCNSLTRARLRRCDVLIRPAVDAQPQIIQLLPL